ncbi:phosphatidate cytidylyltransferase [Physcia stellaris]|nr:phosphatidate cytidylyltransferase [Physcia stellaris]
MDAPPSLLSSSNLPNNGFRKSTGSMNASDLELDTTQSGLQHVSHEADRWKVLQTHSNLEHTPAEHLAGSTSQVRYGDEQMETTERNDDPKEKSGNSPSLGTPVRRKKKFWIYTICIAVTVAIIVVIPTTVTHVLKHRQMSSHSPDPKSTAVIDGQSGSDSGAVNGSAISTIDAGTVDGSYHLFYQHFDGEVKHLTSPNPEEGDWGSRNIISNALSRTPLANAVTSDGSVSTVHLFYLDENMILQEKLYSNTSQKWQDGSLGGYKIPISNSSMIALDANSFSFAEHGDLGYIELFYTSNDSSLHQLQWTFGNGLWNDSYTIGESNGIYRVAVEQITTGHANDLWTVDKLQEIGHWVAVDAPEYKAEY